MGQNEAGVRLHINGYDTGYDTLHYRKFGDKNKTHEQTIALNSDEVVLTDFPQGPGDYEFWLTRGEEYSFITKAYIQLESQKEEMARVLSYIASPVDSSYIQEESSKISPEEKEYVEPLSKQLKSIKEIQEEELRSYYQLISIVERYENIQALTMNRSNCNGITVSYEPFAVTANPAVTSINVYSYENGYKELIESAPVYDKYQPHFAPDIFHEIELMANGELLLRLVHFQFSAEESAYFWKKQKDNLDSEQTQLAMINDSKLSSYGLDISEDDEERIIAERLKLGQQAETPFLPRIEVSEALPGGVNYHDGQLYLYIYGYELLQAMQKPFYVAVRETDIFQDSSFNQRYLIDSPVLHIDTNTELLDDELIFYVEDAEHNIVSPFTRHDMHSDMTAYAHLQNQLEIQSFVSDYLKAFSYSFGEGQYYREVESVLRVLSSDDEITAENLFRQFLISLNTDTALISDIDDILRFTVAAWMDRFPYDEHFFDTRPKFLFSLNTFAFPRRKNRYIIIHERYNLSQKTDGEGIAVSYETGDENTPVMEVIGDYDMHLIYAIDTTDYRRSGYIFVNNYQEHSYSKNNIDIEVVAGG